MESGAINWEDENDKWNRGMREEGRAGKRDKKKMLEERKNN